MKNNPNEYPSVKEATKRWVLENPEKVKGYKSKYNQTKRKEWLKTEKGLEYLERNKMRNKEIKEEYIGFAENLKKIRKEKGFTQRQLAEAMEIKQPNYCKWEKGIFIPSSENLQKLSDVLDVTYEELTEPLNAVEENEG